MKSIYFVIALAALLTVGCNQAKVQETHEDEVFKIYLTAYNPGFELFAESDPLVSGMSCNVLAHFTFLSDFKPLDSASVTVRLVADGNETSLTPGVHLRQGIYNFDITPGAPGESTVVFEVKTPSGTVEIFEIPVVVYPDKQAADEAAERDEPVVTNAIAFTKEQTWKADFSTDLPHLEPFGQVIRTTAQVLSAPDDQIMVTAATSGVIIFSGTNVLEGQRVSPGQVLFTISGSGLADNNSALRYSETVNNYEKAKADYERQSVLAKDKIVSERELLVTEKEYKNAAAAYELLSKNFNISGQKVSCPLAGYVKELFVMNGEFVETGNPLMTVAANRSLILKAGVAQKYATVLDDINSANIRIAETGMTYTLEELHGRVISRGHSTDADNYLVPVVLQIDNISGFIPGGFAEVFLKTVTNTKALTVPNNALLEEQGNFFVMVQVTPELFEKREVKVGTTDGLKSEITMGLDRTERIVTRGAVLVKLSQASGTLDPHAGHVH